MSAGRVVRVGLASDSARNGAHDCEAGGIGVSIVVGQHPRTPRRPRIGGERTTDADPANARTLIKYDDFRVVLIALAGEARMPEHKADGRISIHVLSGHIQLRASGRTFSLRSGGLLPLDHGVSHDVHVLEESALLLTIAWPGRG